VAIVHHRQPPTAPHSSYWPELAPTQTARRQYARLAVPAGEFKTLHYTNHIDFQSYEYYYRIESERDESVWLAPQVGRWVLRRSQGSYYVLGRGGYSREDALQWELESWR
jgi:hypothetical protein